jgi:hypothetical protein
MPRIIKGSQKAKPKVSEVSIQDQLSRIHSLESGVLESRTNLNNVAELLTMCSVRERCTLFFHLTLPFSIYIFATTGTFRELSSGSGSHHSVASCVGQARQAARVSIVKIDQNVNESGRGCKVAG